MTISTSEKMGLVDTNILVYRADQDSDVLRVRHAQRPGEQQRDRHR